MAVLDSSDIYIRFEKHFMEAMTPGKKMDAVSLG